MVGDWESVFETCGFTAEELSEATRSVALRPPKWRSDHLAAVQDAVRNIRLRRWKAQQEQSTSDTERCRFCLGTSWVIVPHPKCYVDGRWSPSETGAYYTAAVACRCFLGRNRIDRVLALSNEEREKKNVQLPLSLDLYERTFPQWESEMRQQVLRDQARRKASANAAHYDSLYGPVLKRIKARVK